MHLTAHTDFALRLLIHLQVTPGSLSVAQWQRLTGSAVII